MNIGIETLRPRLRMTVHRGGVGQRPNRLSATHVVQAHQVIFSGMVMTLVKNSAKSRNEWVKGLTASSLRNLFYLALDDSTDGDNAAAGTFQGLSVSGSYEISTAWTKDLETYSAGDAMTPDGTTGFLKKAAHGDIVIAHVVEDFNPPVNLASTFTGLSPLAGGAVSPGMQGGVFTRAKETNAQSLTRTRMELVTPYILLTSAD